MKWNDTEIVWANFRLAHPDLYSEAMKNGPYWPFVEPREGVR